MYFMYINTLYDNRPLAKMKELTVKILLKGYRI